MPFTRRELLLGAGALPLLAAKKAAAPPNIVVLTADGIGAWMLGSYGNQEIRTPNFDLLAKTGTQFAWCFACSPAAAPSRATLLSGRTPRQLGIEETVTSLGGAPLISDTLAKAGYTCGYAGVWDLGHASQGQHSFSYWRGEPAAPEAITASALAFLDGQKPGQPFFLVIAHAPAEDPPPTYAAMYQNTRFETIGWDRPAANAARGKEALGNIIPSLRKAAAAVTQLDDQVPPILARLQARGVRDNTVVIFTSTCGSLLGRHGLWDSGRGSEPPNMYDEAIAVPMIWSWIKVPPQAVRPELVSLYDLAPSIEEAAGLRTSVLAAAGYPGRSFLRAALNQPYPKKALWHSQVYGEFLNTSMTRDKRFKLVLRNEGKGPNELYDLVGHPRENTNLYDNPQFLTVRDELAGDLAKWRKSF